MALDTPRPCRLIGVVTTQTESGFARFTASWSTVTRLTGTRSSGHRDSPGRDERRGHRSPVTARAAQGAIDLAVSERFDVMLIGGGVPQAEEQEAVAAVRKLIPDVIVKRFYINDEIGPIEIVEGLLAEGPVR